MHKPPFPWRSKRKATTHFTGAQESPGLCKIILAPSTPMGSIDLPDDVFKQQTRGIFAQIELIIDIRGPIYHSPRPKPTYNTSRLQCRVSIWCNFLLRSQTEEILDWIKELLAGKGTHPPHRCRLPHWTFLHCSEAAVGKS